MPNMTLQAAKVCIAEVEELVEPGQLDPDEIHLPGIYVQRIIKGTRLVLAGWSSFVLVL